MESVSEMAAKAAKAVWGESKPTEEPVSGEQGDTSKGEPYDKGNLEEPKSTTNTGDKPTDPSAEFAKNTGTAAESSSVPNTESQNRKASDVPADTSKGQNDVREPSDPKTNPKNAPTDVDDSQGGMAAGQKLDGPGPKPLGEVAAQSGGDAGKAGDAGAGAGNEAEGEEKKQDTGSTNKKDAGTGEKYIKSTGLKADGGDFDATRAGAGKEADRLLEEKGVHHETPGQGGSGGAAGASDNAADTPNGKKSLKEKIKDKLHRH